MAVAALTARDEARYLPRIAIFAYAPAFNVPVRGVPVGIVTTFLCGKTTVVWLPVDKTFLANRLSI